MTRAELALDIKQEMTLAQALPYSIPDKEIERVIVNAERYFYDNWRHAVEPRYLLIPNELLSSDQYKASRTIRLPDCVQFVYDVKEPKGNSMFSTIDRDFAENKFIGSEIFLTPFIGESIVYRTVMFSFLDMTRNFIIDTVAYDYNRNTHCINVTGRTPTKMVVQIAKKIDQEHLYNDEVFQRYVRAKAKVRLGELLTSFDFNLPGGIRPNYTTFVTKADAEFEKVLEMMKNENTPDWLYLVHF
jgi:hypothetical protein